MHQMLTHHASLVHGLFHPILDGCPALGLPRTFDTGIRAGYSRARKARPRALALTKVSDAIASKVQRSSAPPPLCAAAAAAAAAAVSVAMGRSADAAAFGAKIEKVK
jgi:hypothetical protein